jgi:hypothetical protein
MAGDTLTSDASWLTNERFSTPSSLRLRPFPLLVFDFTDLALNTSGDHEVGCAVWAVFGNPFPFPFPSFCLPSNFDSGSDVLMCEPWKQEVLRMALGQFGARLALFKSDYEDISFRRCLTSRLSWGVR